MSKKTEILKFERQVELTKEGRRKHHHDGFGLGVFNLSKEAGFSSMGRWKTVGLAYHVFDDGSRAPVYLLLNDRNELVEKTTQYFMVVD